MQTVSKRLFISVIAFLVPQIAPQISFADTLTDIYESALQNDPVLASGSRQL